MYKSELRIYRQESPSSANAYLFISKALLLREVRSPLEMSHHGVTIMKEHLQGYNVKIGFIAVAPISCQISLVGTVHLASLAIEGPQGLLVLPGDLWPVSW